MFFTLNQVIHLLLTYRYELLFPISVIEGPIITVIGGFLASQNYMNPYFVFIIVVAGDMIGDLLYYYLGRYGGLRFINKFGKYFGVKPEYVLRLEKHFDKHPRKTLIFGKFTHTFGVVVLVTAGMAKMRLGMFMLYNFLPTLPKSAALVLIGFYFGHAYVQINNYLNYWIIAMGLLVVVLVLGYWASTKLSNRYIEK